MTASIRVFTINSTPAPTVLTNNNNATTGISGARWIGINPNTTTGAQGNGVANQGATLVTTNATIVGEVASVFIQLAVTSTLTAGQINYIKVPLKQIGVYYDANTKFFDIRITGITNTAPITDGSGTAPVFVPLNIWNTVDGDGDVNAVGTTGKIHLGADGNGELSAVITIPIASIALYQGKIVTFNLTYTLGT